MTVFISWSGERSNKLAKLLNDWLPKVLQHCKPWLSEDIPAGAMWAEEISKKLREATFGIICVTPENSNAPWLCYEAGALANKMGVNSLVCPLLLDMDIKHLGSPLNLFHAKNALNKNDMLALLTDINNSFMQDHRIKEKILIDAFNNYWDEFHEAAIITEKLPIPYDVISEVNAPVPNVSFDCTQEEFINHLSRCDEVTILGITNRNLYKYLKLAWEKRKQIRSTPWNKIEIIFLAKHLLDDMPFPDDLDEDQKSLENRNNQWEFGVEKARNYLRSSTNPDIPSRYRARYVEIRSYDKPIPFVGQVYDHRKVRVAYILPDRDIRSSCYMNLEMDIPPCKDVWNQQPPYLEDEDSPPCKKLYSQQVDCDSCTWKKGHSPCYAIYNTFNKIKTRSTPLCAANIVGRIRDRQRADLKFHFSSLRPQNNWRISLKTLVPEKPAHLVSFILLRYGNQALLQFRNEENSSGEFNRYGVLPGKVNDVDFFDSLPDEEYREHVYKMQKAWDERSPYLGLHAYRASSNKASSIFAERLNIQIDQPINSDLLNKACIRAAKRSIREKIRLEVAESRLTPVDKSFIVKQGDYELFIRFFILDLATEELGSIAASTTPNLELKTAEEIVRLKDNEHLTDFMMKYTDDVLEKLSA
jgi:hypothetical protein